QWQHSIAPPAQAIIVDAQGSLLNVGVGHNLHQLVALDHRGALQWKTFATSEDFSLPVVSSQTDTVLVALSGHASSANNTLMIDDITSYLSPLQLYLFKRGTGQTIWQKTIVAPDQQ